MIIDSAEQLFYELKNVKDNTTFIIKNGVYHIYFEDCFHLENIYSTNSSSLKNNPKGRKNPFFFLDNKENITIDGNNSTFILHGIITEFLFNKCRNILIKNLNISYYNPTMFEFEIINSSLGKITILPNKDNNCFIQDNTLYWTSLNKNDNPYYLYGVNNENTLGMIFDKENNTLSMLPYHSSKTRFPSLPEIKSVSLRNDSLIDIEFIDNNILFPTNSIVQIRDVSRNDVGVFVVDSENITFNQVNIDFMNGMGMVFQNTNNIYIDNVNIIPKEGRIISSNADFFHFSGCKGEIKITNSKAIGAHDDVINVHGLYLNIDKVKDKTLILSFPHLESFGIDAFLENEDIEIIDKNTLLSIYKTKVRNVHNLDLFHVEIEVDDSLLNINDGNYVVENVSRCPSLLVKNCHFERIATRAILYTSRKKAIIENSTFNYINGPLLYISDDANEWYESGGNVDLEFINNQVISCDQGYNKQGEMLIEVRPMIKSKHDIPIHQQLLIKDNTILKPFKDKSFIYLSHIKNVSIINNRFEKGYEIKLENKDINLIDDNNKII